MKTPSTLVIIAATLAVWARGDAADFSWTTLPIPRDASRVAQGGPGAAHWRQRVTTFELKRAFPNADFVANLDTLLGPEWLYYDGRPEGWQVYVEPGQQWRTLEATWCNPDERRTIIVVLEYGVDEELQRVAVSEQRHHWNPCKWLEWLQYKPNANRPGG